MAHLADTKNGTSRDVPLSSKAIEVLSQLQQVAEDNARTEAKTAQKGRKSKRHVDAIDLQAARVLSVSGDTVTQAFERAVQRARKSYVEDCKKNERPPDSRFLIDLRFHDLRHEATSRLAGIYQLHELTKITGHKEPRMLMRYYHPDVEELAKRLS